MKCIDLGSQGHILSVLPGSHGVDRKEKNPRNRQSSWQSFGNVILGIDFWRRLWTRFGPQKGTCSSESFLLYIPMEWSAEKGIPISGKPSPCKHLCLTSCLHVLAFMFSLTLHLNLHHFDCLSAGFISPLLLFSEASLWRWQALVVAEEWFHWPPRWTIALFCLPPLLTLCYWLLLFHEAAFWQSTTVSADTKFGKSWGLFWRCPSDA